MSIEMLTAAWAVRDLRVAERLVLLALADHAAKDGTGARPAVSTIAAMCEIGERAVQKNLRRLEDRGLIEIQEPQRGRSARVYRLVLGANHGSGRTTVRGERTDTLGANELTVGANELTRRGEPRFTRSVDPLDPSSDPDRVNGDSARTTVHPEDTSPHRAPSPSLTSRLYEIHRDLTGGAFLNGTEDDQIRELARAVTAEDIDGALAEIRAWDSPPRKPWKAFARALGDRRGARLLAEQRGPAVREPEGDGDFWSEMGREAIRRQA